MKKLLKGMQIGFCCLTASVAAVALSGSLTNMVSNSVSASAETVIEAEAATGTTVVLDYAVNKNNTVTVTVSIDGDVRFASFVGELHYDSSVLTYSTSSAIYSGVYLNNSSAGEFAFSFASATDITSAVDMFSVTFSYSGTINTNVSLVITEGNFCTASFDDVTYSVSGGNIVVDGTENKTDDSSTGTGSDSSSDTSTDDNAGDSSSSDTSTGDNAGDSSSSDTSTGDNAGDSSSSGDNTSGSGNDSDTTDYAASCATISGGDFTSTGLMVIVASALLFSIRKLYVNKLKKR